MGTIGSVAPGIPRAVIAVAYASVALIVAACSGPAASQSSTAGPSATLTVTSVAQAEPLPTDGFTVVKRWPSPHAGESVAVLGTNGDTELLAYTELSTAMAISPQRLELWAPAGTVTIPRPAHKPLTQVFGADLDGHNVVWLETPSIDLAHEPWKLMRFNRSTGTVTELASSPLLDDGSEPPSPPGYVGAVLAGEWVYWSQVAGTSEALRNDVWGCPIDRCTPTQIATGAGLQTGDADGVYALRAGLLSSDPGNQPARIIKIVDGTVTNGSVATIPTNEGIVPNGLAAADNKLVWTATRPAQGSTPATRAVLHVIDDHGANLYTIEGPAFGFPLLTDRYAAWAQPGMGAGDIGGWVLDLTNGALHTIGNQNGLYNIGGSSSTLYWQEAQRGHDRSGTVTTIVSQLH